MRPVAVLLHGALRTRLSLWLLERALRRAGFEVWNQSYPWHSRSLPELAAALKRQLDRFEDRELYFVTHSFGSLVLRKYCQRYQPRNARRAVLLAPPSRGSCIAKFNSENPLLLRAFTTIFGKAALRLTPSAVERIPPPSCEFAVIAGGRGKPRGYSPLLPGDNDGIVCVEETKLPGMAGFALVPHAHSFIMNGRDTIRLTMQFLKTGKLGT